MAGRKGRGMNTQMATGGPKPAALLTVRDVAAMLRIGPRTVWREAAKAEAGLCGFPRPLRLAPKIVRWRLADVERYLSDLAATGR